LLEYCERWFPRASAKLVGSLPADGKADPFLVLE
jgi:hypothetical protein